MNDVTKLNGIKDKLEEAKTKKANIEGRIASKKEQLVALGFKNTKTIIEDAEKEIVVLGKTIDSNSVKLEGMLKVFKGKYPSLFEE